MGTVDWIVIAALVPVVGAAIFYILHQKRRGKRCIGCPHADTCSSQCNCKDAEKH